MLDVYAQRNEPKTASPVHRLAKTLPKFTEALVFVFLFPANVPTPTSVFNAQTPYQHPTYLVAYDYNFHSADQMLTSCRWKPLIIY